MENFEIWSLWAPYHKIQLLEAVTLKCMSYERINIWPKPLLDTSSARSFLPCDGSQHRKEHKAPPELLVSCKLNQADREG